MSKQALFDKEVTPFVTFCEENVTKHSAPEFLLIQAQSFLESF